MNDNQRPVKVAKVVDPYRVVLNIGSNQGASVGDDYVLFRVGEQIYDPDTGEFLGEFEEVIGRGTITHVQGNISTLESSEVNPSGRKVIKKYNSEKQSAMFSVLAGMYGPSEEIIEETEKTLRAFSNAEIGDSARKT